MSPAWDVDGLRGARGSPESVAGPLRLAGRPASQPHVRMLGAAGQGRYPGCRGGLPAGHPALPTADGCGSTVAG